MNSLFHGTRGLFSKWLSLHRIPPCVLEDGTGVIEVSYFLSELKYFYTVGSRGLMSLSLFFFFLPLVCEILVPDQAWDLSPLHWKHRVLTPGKSLLHHLPFPPVAHQHSVSLRLRQHFFLFLFLFFLRVAITLGVQWCITEVSDLHLP